MRRPQQEALGNVLKVLAGTLISLLLAGSAWALTATDCATCHGADVIEGHHDTTDPNSDFNQKLCNKCHVGITTGNDCSTCHQPAGYTFNSHHLPQTGQTAINCAQCHTGAGNPKDCGSCHKGEIPRNFHHTRLTAYRDTITGKLNCTICHPGSTLTSDCKSCHDEGSDAYKAMHHSYINPTTNSRPACTSCHAELAPTTGSCQDCHAPRVKAFEHHYANDIQSGQRTIPRANCTLCHSGLAVSGDPAVRAGCVDCHGAAGNNSALHHDSVMPSKSLLCSDCHKNVPTAAGDCTGCHLDGTTPTAVSIHHVTKANTTTYFAAGNCQICHTTISASNGDCSSCHLKPATPTAREIHHITKTGTTTAYAAGNCSICHAATGFVNSASTTTAPSCNSTACHIKLLADPHHDPSKISQNTLMVQAGLIVTKVGSSGTVVITNCANCHDAGIFSTPTANRCLFCHKQYVNPLKPAPYSIESKHHDPAQPFSANCTTCHTAVGTTTGDCAVCHSATGIKPASQQTHHNYIDPATQAKPACSICHNGASPATSDCATCHGGATPLKPATQQSHHIAAKAQGASCSTCHAGTSLPTTCSTCHTSDADTTTAERHHDFTSTNNNCTACHVGANNVYQTCGECHLNVLQNNTIVTLTSAAYHHMSNAYTLKPCATCHVGVDQTPLNDCAVCHIGSNKPSTLARHHSTDSYLTGNCAECHVNTVSANIPCAGCHTSSLTKHHSKTVAVNGTTQPKPCKDCHSTIAINGSTCATCHTLPIGEFHHDNGPDGPLTAVGGNCAVCHQSVSDPNVCANCHTSTPHHATSWSQTGDCAHCHAVPAWAADRPAQAACRECHGTTMHGKGGPIQNYGACAACHNQLPYHPAPTSIPGYTGYGAGKGKFNIFWSKYAIKEGPGEKFSTNGRDVNDEGGYRIKAQQLTFSTKQISSNGKTYTVPYFTGAANTNLALKKTATASGAESGYGAALAVDGDVATRWWKKVSTTTSTQWVKVDLGALKTVNRVALRWGSYYATQYEIRVSTDNSRWTTVADANYGKGGFEQWNFSGRSVRYIQIYCQKASSLNGFSIYELEAYAP